MNYLEKTVNAIEEHSIVDLRDCFKNGINPNDYFGNDPLIFELTSEYLRSPRFKECVRVFVDFGLIFDDQLLLTVLLDDAPALEDLLNENPALVNSRYTLRCAFTPLHEVTLLHICAEFNHVDCATILIGRDADINARAGFDENGFGGQTPVFHTVNQIHNQSSEMLALLLSHSADLEVTLKGLIWGKDYPWETFIPGINPLSYAMMGLLPQMHRNESDIAETVSLLMKSAFNIDYTLPNIPNHYLRS
ncbi:ankyrin repeat domain-containing protein [Emticicia sp. BO119]|uniref:ankyrin repeat domain-containing protein n=1 Tax=Emticicia sp. BO119 TaxID=2757768 RepID=UPI0015F0FBE8|nr:ankyrin repeat domain-containing protein [Emticicia sp. BO119]MBA4849142.1 ankyrin repeat domain-containing protein [Emticicia sp. BO119]